MTEEQINIAIAESLGYHSFESVQKWGEVYTEAIPASEPRRTGSHVRIPDFCNDLNAIHEAEKALTDRAGYVSRLYDVARVTCGTATEWTALTHATALQRAEAYLRTIGKWEQ